MEGFLNPSEILTQLELGKNMVAADFGCGSGGWAMPLAKILEEGEVYAIDILEEPLSALESRAKLEGLINIQIITADVEEEVPLSPNSVDLVLMTNLLFECEDREGVFRQALKVLKLDGKILVVDWKVDAPVGPEQGRISAEEVKKLAETFSLKLKRKLEAGKYHYGLLFIKK